jgi:imidazolonepropionase
MNSPHPRELALTNAIIASMDSSSRSEFGLLQGLHAIVIKQGVIQAVTPMAGFSPPGGAHVLDLGGRLVTPGLIDSHTHVVFAGDRAREWSMRLEGRTYEDIAVAGGGILSTVKATRAASEQELLELALERLSLMARDGVTCVEVKSGYGLSIEDELKILRVVKRLKVSQPIEVSATLLAAHTVPPEFASNPDDYVQLICEALIPRVSAEGLAESVDVFCEPIAFSLSQCERIFDAAQAHGLAIRAHAEQLSRTGCALAAAARGALSVDHLEHLSEQDAAALRGHKTAAVLLPGAFYALREKKLPPIKALRSAGVPIAVATDCNPGTSPFSSLRMMMNLACIIFSLSPEEALMGATRNAALALGREERLGTVAVGKEATLCVWSTKDVASIVFDLSRPLLYKTFIRGEVQHA